ncbi:MAG TPA: hypothetical protein VK192_15005 [Sphingomicrobium sp.]|jgi:hypothetical protein|nr:hypothetical protein [Sphingomicrobium sp.]
MNTNEEVLLQKMADTLDSILVELRRGADRHDELDKSAAKAEDIRRNPYRNI